MEIIQLFYHLPVFKAFVCHNSCVSSGNHRGYSEICPTELGNEVGDFKISSEWITAQNTLGTSKIFYKQFRLNTINLGQLLPLVHLALD